MVNFVPLSLRSTNPMMRGCLHDRLAVYESLVRERKREFSDATGTLMYAIFGAMIGAAFDRIRRKSRNPPHPPGESCAAHQ